MKRASLIACGLLGIVIGLVAWDFSVRVLENDDYEQTAPVIHEFNPIRKEFKLDNGTPCVMVWAPQRAQSAGISCDWGYNSRFNVN